MKKRTDTIRVKLIIAILGSAAMAGICMGILGIVFIIASVSRKFALFFFEHFFLFMVSFLVIFVVLMLVFFLMLIRKSIQYLEDITKTLKNISDGNLEITIPVRSNDELGIMASTVNDMAYKLMTSIEEERRFEKTKIDLITNISHDLRTPLTSILGYLELLINTWSDDEARNRKYLSIAYNKCKDLKVLIDDLFEYSKLNNTEIVINKVKISLGELLEQVIIGFIPALSEAGMEYRLSFINEKIFISADPVLLTRVFDNLINNAIKYGKDGKYLDIELLRENGYSVVRVINYGKAIDEQNLPYIFEKYYQADKSSSRDQEGSGLGLAIVKRIVEMHDGSISASSTDNRTIFEISL